MQCNCNTFITHRGTEQLTINAMQMQSIYFKTQQSPSLGEIGWVRQKKQLLLLAFILEFIHSPSLKEPTMGVTFGLDRYRIEYWYRSIQSDPIRNESFSVRFSFLTFHSIRCSVHIDPVRSQTEAHFMLNYALKK